MAEEKKLTDEQLDAVAGGINDVNLAGSSAGGNQTVYDEHVENHTENYNVKGDLTQGDGNTKAGGDITGGNKTDTDVITDIKADVNVKRSIF